MNVKNLLQSQNFIFDVEIFFCNVARIFFSRMVYLTLKLPFVPSSGLQYYWGNKTVLIESLHNSNYDDSLTDLLDNFLILFNIEFQRKILNPVKTAHCNGLCLSIKKYIYI